MPRSACIATIALLSFAPCKAHETAGVALNGKIQIAYWVHGAVADVPLIMINGQGVATRSDGDALVDALVAEGYRVITFDNRDSGRSTLLSAESAAEISTDGASEAKTGNSPVSAYDLGDMASDAIAVLDAADIDRAHVVGHSLGSMIAHMVAVEHPGRVISLISISSSSGESGLSLGPALAALSDPHAFASLNAVEAQVKAYRIFEGETPYRMSDEEVLTRVTADMIANDPNAAMRQAAAAIATGDRRELLKHVRSPALVIHGSEDPWFPLEHAQSVASSLTSRLEVIKGMGHIVPDSLGMLVADRIHSFIRTIDSPYLAEPSHDRNVNVIEYRQK